MVVNNFYNQQELDLIKELDFYTAPNKLVSAENLCCRWLYHCKIINLIG